MKLVNSLPFVNNRAFARVGAQRPAGPKSQCAGAGPFAPRQRLAIASALLHDPEVIIIDEPMVGLDPKNVRIVKEELKARSKAGTTVFLSTHLLNVAQELADRIGIINEGRLVALGRVDEILSEKEGNEGRDLEEAFLEITGSGEDFKDLK